MAKISFSGEQPQAFDGMMMSYDAKKGREEKGKQRAEFFKEKSVEQAKIDEEFAKDEGAWQLHEKLTEEQVIKEAGTQSYWTSNQENKRRVANNSKNKVSGKGAETIRKVPGPDFEVPEDSDPNAPDYEAMDN